MPQYALLSSTCSASYAPLLSLSRLPLPGPKVEPLAPIEPSVSMTEHPATMAFHIASAIGAGFQESPRGTAPRRRLRGGFEHVA